MLPGFENEQRNAALGQWYTPTELAKRMAELVDLRGKRVLEPSAGSGNLVRAALDAGAREVECVDIDTKNGNAQRERFAQERAERRVIVRLSADFLRWECGVGVDVALMNPPWDDGQHWKHIAHALKFAPIVVALAPLAMLEGEDRRTEFWSKCHLSDLCVCSSRPKFGEDGGKMPVACYVLKRNGPLPRGDAAHYTAVRFW